VGESLVDSCIRVLIRAPSATVGRLHSELPELAPAAIDNGIILRVKYNSNTG
jgi:hypothetical protein